MTATSPSGKELRKNAPRSSHAAFTVDDRDPVAIIREQNETRLQDLVPVRVSRMLHSPFSFYRGGAALMAHDLSSTPNIGAHVMSCGDAHISNFGLFASPERRLLFDVNDFDEAAFAPWEWDVKRLAASIMIAARDNSYTDEQGVEAVVTAVGAYRQRLAELMQQGALDRYFVSVDVDTLSAAADESGDQTLKELIEQTAKKARKRPPPGWWRRSPLRARTVRRRSLRSRRRWCPHRPTWSLNSKVPSLVTSIPSAPMWPCCCHSSRCSTGLCVWSEWEVWVPAVS
ncbi:hypothetical protein TPAU25S_00015 [Tsukamurella paurometabola]